MHFPEKVTETYFTDNGVANYPTITGLIFFFYPILTFLL